MPKEQVQGGVCEVENLLLFNGSGWQFNWFFDRLTDRLKAFRRSKGRLKAFRRPVRRSKNPIELPPWRDFTSNSPNLKCISRTPDEVGKYIGCAQNSI